MDTRTIHRSVACGCISAAVVVGTAAAAQERPLDYRLAQTLHDWRGDMQGSGVAHYAIIGDSISFRVDSYNWFLRDLLEADAGNAGDGYLALTPAFRHVGGGRNRRPGLGFRMSSIWAEAADAAGPRDQLGQRAIDGLYGRIGASGWIEVDFYGPRATLHYIREPGAGMIRIEVNGLEVALIDADAPDVGFGLHTFETGQQDPSVLSTARFSLVGASSADPQWTQLNGLHLTTDEPGVMYSRLGRGGSGPDEFLTSDPAIFGDVLSALAPDLVVIMTDHSGKSPYQPDLTALVQRVEDAVPDAEILFITHHNFRPSAPDDADVMLNVAQARSHGFLNLVDLHEGFDHLSALGFLVDTVHFSAAGGEWFGGFIHKALLGWLVPREMDITLGSIIEGDLYELRASDEDHLRVRSSFGFTSAEPNLVRLVAWFNSDHPSPAEIDLRIEWGLNVPGGSARFLLRNHSTSLMQQVGTSSLGTAEEVQEIVGIPAASFIREGDGEISLQARCAVMVVFSSAGFVERIDHLQARVR